MEPLRFKDKIRVSGVLQLIPIDESRCRRIREIRVQIRIFGIGAILESMAAEQANRTSEKFTQVVARWKTMNT
jgi:hypothetical protein